MSDRSAIEWTHATWNPVRGCTKISPGCKHCYAERFSERFRGTPGHPFEQGFDLRLVPSALDLPLKWREGRLIFVNSMSDLFHEDVPTEFVERVFRVMSEAGQHQFQVLTKRADRLLKFTNRRKVPENVWLGVSVENAAYRWRIDCLRQIEARVRFLSIEPLLGSVGLLDLRQIDWVIVGGESGPHARAMAPEWVREIREQCVAARVPFFFKQWGGRWKHRTGRELDGRTWDEMPAGICVPSERPHRAQVRGLPPR
ncbi:MAG TPA: phage Gp37/Gp68 family protein [Polyangia bacterium]|nr:phage Gp37/Gp68 family protein [Polyangia bacterium]